MKTAFEDKRDMETISNAVRTFWRKYAVIIIAPVLAAAVSLSYFIVKSDDSMTAQSEEIKNNGVLPEIVSGQKYIQKIHSDKNGLTKISLLLGTYGRENFSNVYVSLSDSTGNVIKNWNLNSVPLNEDNTYHAFTLDRQIQNSKDQTYFITITSDAVIGNGITVYKSSLQIQDNLPTIMPTHSLFVITKVLQSTKIYSMKSRMLCSSEQTFL